MKKMLSILLAVMMIATLALTGCGQNNDPAPTPDPEPTTRTFTDSLGREVTLPVNLSKIAISGPLAQIVVFAIAPDMMVGIANGWADEAKGLIPDEYYNLPLLGQLYGGKAINKFIIFTMYFSGGMIPNYILMVSLGLRDTVASFILPGMISTYYVILMRSFFLTLPRELEEAGEIDGLDKWGVFWRIAIPLSKPIIATMTLF